MPIGDVFLFFSLFFFGWETHSLQRCNERNQKCSRRRRRPFTTKAAGYLHNLIVGKPLICKSQLASPKGASYTGRGDGWAPLACGSLAGWSCNVTSPEGGVLMPCSFRLLSRRRLSPAMCCSQQSSLTLPCLTLKHPPSYSFFYIIFWVTG